MSDFSDRPLVAGVLVGQRGFRVDRDGRLRGIVYRDPITSGWTEATCHARQHRGRPGVATVDCECGFYAYFDDSNDYVTGKRRWRDSRSCAMVGAIIEGAGVATVGDRGFRASRARLVAIYDPAPRCARWLQPVVIAARVLVAAVSVYFFCLMVADATLGHAIMLDLALCAEAYLMLSPAAELAARRISRRRWAKIAATYPDVPIYPSARVALANHKLGGAV